MRQRPAVAVLVPTYRPDEKFFRLLTMLGRQTMPVNQLVIMNTESSLWDGRKYEEIRGIPKPEVHHVSKREFDHGKTRGLGMGYVRTDICVCMTQDAVPADEFLIENLVAGLGSQGQSAAVSEILGPRIAAAYGRQLPAEDCGLIERYTRAFNYPEQSAVKTKADLPRLGIKTYFCSNVCAAYDMEIYRSLGGFIERTIFNEDMIFAAGAVQAGYGIAYRAEARVVHSHNYSAMEQLRRNFDLGVSQADHPEIFSGLPSEGEGIRMVKQTAAWLCKHHRYDLLPQLTVQSGFKYLGYRLGRSYRKLPAAWIRKLTMSPNYWR